MSFEKTLADVGQTNSSGCRLKIVILDVGQKYLAGVSRKNPSQHQQKNLANVIKKYLWLVLVRKP